MPVPSPGTADPRTWKLSPSDLTFLWEECRRCFYLKVRKKLNRPRSAFPSIFTRIDGLMKDHFVGRHTASFNLGLPAGVIQHGTVTVETAPLSPPGASSRCYISGRTDAILQFDNGAFGVLDFKTACPKDRHVALYSRQLHSYALCLEQPSPRKLRMAPVTHLGLLCVEPTHMAVMDNHIAYRGPATWVEIERNDAAFLAFLAEVVTLLDAPSPPPANDGCTWCRYAQEVADYHRYLASQPAATSVAAP